VIFVVERTLRGLAIALTSTQKAALPEILRISRFSFFFLTTTVYFRMSFKWEALSSNPSPTKKKKKKQKPTYIEYPW
jgi:hypothetical protein